MENLQFGSDFRAFKDALILFFILDFIILFYGVKFLINNRDIEYYFVFKLFGGLLILSASILSVIIIKIVFFLKTKSKYEFNEEGLILRGPFIKDKIIKWTEMYYYSEVLVKKSMPTISIYLKNNDKYYNGLNFFDKLAFKYNKNKEYGDINFLQMIVLDDYDKILKILDKHINRKNQI